MNVCEFIYLSIERRDEQFIGVVRYKIFFYYYLLLLLTVINLESLVAHLLHLSRVL